MTQNHTQIIHCRCCGEFVTRAVYQRHWVLRNREHIRAWARQYHRTNPARRAYLRKAYLLNRPERRLRDHLWQRRDQLAKRLELHWCAAKCASDPRVLIGLLSQKEAKFRAASRAASCRSRQDPSYRSRQNAYCRELTKRHRHKLAASFDPRILIALLTEHQRQRELAEDKKKKQERIRRSGAARLARSRAFWSSVKPQFLILARLLELAEQIAISQKNNRRNGARVTEARRWLRITPDDYVASILCRGTSLKRDDLPPDLIKLQREYLRLRRELNPHKTRHEKYE